MCWHGSTTNAKPPACVSVLTSGCRHTLHSAPLAGCSGDGRCGISASIAASVRVAVPSFEQAPLKRLAASTTASSEASNEAASGGAAEGTADAATATPAGWEGCPGIGYAAAGSGTGG